MPCPLSDMRRDRSDAAEEGDAVSVLGARLDEITTELLRSARGDASWLDGLVGLRVKLDIALHRRDRRWAGLEWAPSPRFDGHK